MEEMSQPIDSTSESIEELKIAVENYHNLLIKKERELADAKQDLKIREMVIEDMTNEGVLRLESTLSFLRNHLDKFQLSLLFEACIRLVIVLTLWVLVLIQTGFTLITILSLILTVTIYIGLEILVVNSNLEKAEEATYTR